MAIAPRVTNQPLPLDQKQLLDEFFNQLLPVCLAALATYQPGAVASSCKKDKFDLVTAADLAVNEVLVSAISSTFPDDRIISEEAEEAADQPGLAGAHGCWYIDPIDGTTDFVHGLAGWTVSIAYEDQHGLAAAMIIDPVGQEDIRAYRGHGATLNGQLLPRQPDPIDPDEDLVLAALQIRGSKERVGNFFQNFGWAWRRTGGAAYGLSQTALRRCSICYLEIDTSSWDVLAGILICREVGLSVGYYPLAHNGSNARLLAGPTNLVELLLESSDKP